MYSMFKKGLLFVGLALVCVSSAFAAPPDHFPEVKTERDGMTYNFSHKLRVTAVGMDIAIHHFKLSPHYKDALFDYLMEHDDEKLNNKKEFIHEYGGHLDDARYSAFFIEHFGEDFPVDSPHRIIIKHMNEIGKVKAQRFFARSGMLDLNLQPNFMARLFMRIEKIADLIDRDQDSMAPIELGREKTFGIELLDSDYDRGIAKATIVRYQEITAGYHYWEIKDYFREHPVKVTEKFGNTCSNWLELLN